MKRFLPGMAIIVAILSMSFTVISIKSNKQFHNGCFTAIPQTPPDIPVFDGNNEEFLDEPFEIDPPTGEPIVPEQDCPEPVPEICCYFVEHQPNGQHIVVSVWYGDLAE